MDYCRCKQYQEQLKNFKCYTLCTFHPVIPRLPVPENTCVVIRKNHIFKPDIRTNKPHILPMFGEKMQRPIIENKWIPILPGLISDKLVNEGRSKYTNSRLF